MDADVVIVGAGPVGLMLAGELCLAGVRPLILERQPRLRETPKASGFNGQIVELLRYRGLLDRAGQDPRGFHPDRSRRVRVRAADTRGPARSDHRRRARRHQR
jgi:2-polyprenyl-6-methoxyphenol hydroxylase-like FAD-dependent oxidoreductase